MKTVPFKSCYINSAINYRRADPYITQRLKTLLAPNLGQRFFRRSIWYCQVNVTGGLSHLLQTAGFH